MKIKKIGSSILINEDCLKTIKQLPDNSIDLVLTSPPYNTGRNHGSMDNHERRYDIYLEQRDNEEYLNWICDIFNGTDRILKENGCILYNVSYGVENPNSFYLFPYYLINNTNFMIADTIIWKKKSALPNNVSSNKLTRICEFVFVICRKDEYKTFNANKKIKSISKTGQKFYENIYNFIEANNNDGSCKLNKATFSTSLCTQLLNMYAKENSVIFDPFSGTFTTAVACKELGLKFIGTELSENQFNYGCERLGEINE